ncbi:hypothetical protein Q31a_08000 [Aureliella helgolandensis]|uniref:Uncharacterized protein n=1 Tax=Aureliella helgolandensis TaxID=2527968 RepID=A0A518G1R2_9BACT|nr:hypothetical protein Q31a_08000 [Aureliella helgolandensis]
MAVEDGVVEDGGGSERRFAKLQHRLRRGSEHPDRNENERLAAVAGHPAAALRCPVAAS